MITGLIAPLLTPFDNNLAIDQDKFNFLAKRLLATGCAGLAPFGTTGEALSLSTSERKMALKRLVASGVDASVLIPGTGLCNMPDTIELCRHALELGCAGVMTLPPFYFKGVSDAGIYEYFVQLINEINDDRLKIYLYHIPQISGIGFSISLVAKLHQEFSSIVVGIKDSSGSWKNTKSLLEINGLIVYPGSELPVIEAIQLGAPGCISATANLNSANIAKVITLSHAKDWGTAEAKHEEVRGVRMLLQDYAPIPAQKALLARQLDQPSWRNVRPPMQPMTTDRAQTLADALNTQFGMKF
jgi:4-hydroxy-tetrahydrodipicolinate synthase